MSDSGAGIGGSTARWAIRIERVSTESAEVRELIRELDGELSQNYAPEQRHGLSLAAIFQPHIRFFVVMAYESPAACGGIALFPGFGELKRMYVRPAFRGAGVADRLMAYLEEQAAGAGLTKLRLETGTLQSAAIRFYERCGYRTCAAFEPYASMPPESIATSVFMEKDLDPTRP